MKAHTPVRALVSRIVREADDDDPVAYAMAENALIAYEDGDSSGVPKILLFTIYEKLAMEAWRSERSGSAQAIERIRQKIESGSADKIAGVFDDLIDIAIYAGAEALNRHSVVVSRSLHWYDQLKKAVGRETDDLGVARKAANLVFQMVAEAKTTVENRTKARRSVKSESATDYPEGWLTAKGGGDHWTGAQSSWRVYKGPHNSLLAGTIFPDLSGKMFTALHELTGKPPAPNDEKAWHKLMMRKAGNLMFKGWKSGSLAALQRVIDTEAAKYL